jgi:hypothetical protein
MLIPALPMAKPNLITRISKENLVKKQRGKQRLGLNCDQSQKRQTINQGLALIFKIGRRFSNFREKSARILTSCMKHNREKLLP